MFRPHLVELIVALVIIATLPGSSAAMNLPDQDTRALPCRPTITCTADLTQPGVFEIELGFITRRLGSGNFQYATPLLLKLTLAEWVQLQVGTNGGVFLPTGPSQASYLDNISLGGKFHVRDQTEDGPSTSLSIAISVPSYAGQGAYIPVYDAFFVLYLSKDFSWLHADMNAGVSALRLNGSPRLQGFSSLVLSVSLPRSFGLMLEGYGFTDASPVASPDAGVLMATCFSPKPWLTLDLGVDAGLIQSVRSFSLFTGLTVVPVDFWETAEERRRKGRHP
jgi:hypothetical protein